jgi:hypothetical protein
MGWSDVSGWVGGLFFIYSGMFGVGKVILAEWMAGAIYLTVAVAAAVFVFRSSLFEEIKSDSG